MTASQISPECDSELALLPSQSNPLHRILLVDDDGDIRRLNAEVLLQCGYAVEEAEDGAAGWDALQIDSYDLLITDNRMPKVTGVELLKKLHAARLDMPVIMATGNNPQAEFQRYPWLQPAAILLKPYTVEELCRTVKKVLRELDHPTVAVRAVAEAPLAAPLNAPSPAPAVEPRSDRANASPRILVVDEDRDLRQLYAEVLGGPGYFVDAVADGAAGWAALQRHPYQLLITEHDMPKLTGVELVKKLRAAHMALPVVMAVGRTPTAELARNPALCLAAIMVKPFAVDALLHTVKNALQEASAQLPASFPLTEGPHTATNQGWQL